SSSRTRCVACFDAVTVPITTLFRSPPNSIGCRCKTHSLYQSSNHSHRAHLSPPTCCVGCVDAVNGQITNRTCPPPNSIGCRCKTHRLHQSSNHSHPAHLSPPTLSIH